MSEKSEKTSELESSIKPGSKVTEYGSPEAKSVDNPAYNNKLVLPISEHFWNVFRMSDRQIEYEELPEDIPELQHRKKVDNKALYTAVG